MCFLNGWHPFESIRFDPVIITMWRCLVLQIWEQQKQLRLNQRSNPIKRMLMLDVNTGLPIMLLTLED